MYSPIVVQFSRNTLYPVGNGPRLAWGNLNGKSCRWKYTTWLVALDCDPPATRNAVGRTYSPPRAPNVSIAWEAGVGQFGLYNMAAGFLFWLAMWIVNELFDASVLDTVLPAAGFAVGSTRGVARVEKYGCAAEFRKTPDGRYQMTIPPSILVGGQFTRLWDAGYQKFLLTDDGRKLPALAPQLASLRRFSEELRTALGVPAYYNDALGSTCHVTSYDRVKGRRGDVPDEGVGVKPGRDH